MTDIDLTDDEDEQDDNYHHGDVVTLTMGNDSEIAVPTETFTFTDDTDDTDDDDTRLRGYTPGVGNRTIEGSFTIKTSREMREMLLEEVDEIETTFTVGESE